MADETSVVDDDEALLAPLRDKVRATQPDAQFQLLRTDPRIGPVILRSPTEAEFQLWQRSLDDESTKSTATYNLFVTLCVSPPRGGTVLQKFPGYLLSKPVQGALKYLTGMASDAVGKS